MEFQKLQKKHDAEHPVTRFLKLATTAVIATGPFSCICFASECAVTMEQWKRLFVCEMTPADYMNGGCRERVLQLAKKAAEIPEVSQIILYQCCTDFLTHMDYESYLQSYFASGLKKIKIYTFQRGSASVHCSRKKWIEEQIRKDSVSENVRQEAKMQCKKAIQEEYLSLPEKLNLMADYAAVCEKRQRDMALICIFSPGSCTAALELANLEEENSIYLSRMTEEELILGCAQSFAEAAAKLAGSLHYNTIYVIGTPVVKLLYTDFRESANLLAQKGFQVRLFETDGYTSIEETEKEGFEKTITVREI